MNLPDQKLRYSVKTMEDVGPANFKDKEWTARWHESQKSYAYDKQCQNCGEIVTVLTKEDRNPEYYTQIYVICACKSKISFDLPVN